MRASIGGIVNLFAIAVFLIVLASFLLFNVSYAKAFRVKNKIITTYEQYEGNCDRTDSACYKEIQRFEKAFGYKVTYELPEKEGTTCFQELGYCSTKSTYKKKIDNVTYTAEKYTIRTEVYIRFPFIQDIFGIGKFGVSGETHEILKFN